MICRDGVSRTIVGNDFDPVILPDTNTSEEMKKLQVSLSNPDRVICTVDSRVGCAQIDTDGFRHFDGCVRVGIRKSLL